VREAELMAQRELLEREAPAGAHVRVLVAAPPVLGRTTRLGVNTQISERSPWRLPNEDELGEAGPWLLGSEPGVRNVAQVGRGPRLGMAMQI